LIQHLTDDDWNTFRTNHPKSVVMFYAPWCEACTQFKPMFAGASRELEKDGITLGALDCEIYGIRCKSLNVKRFPTVIYFESSADKLGTLVDYITGPVGPAGVVNWVRNHLSSSSSSTSTSSPPPSEDTARASWDDVPQLTSANFESSRSHQHMLVMFYAPWDSHCTALKPAFATAASALQAVAALAAVDCTTQETLCERFEVQSFPTMKWFPRNAPDGELYTSRRRASKDIVAFVREKLSHAEL